MHILLVSDDILFSKNIEDLLKKENINIKTVKNIYNINLQLLYENFNMLIIESNLQEKEMYEIFLLRQRYPQIQITLINKNRFSKKAFYDTDDSKYCYLLPNFNAESLFHFIKSFKDKELIKSKNTLTYEDLCLNRKTYIAHRGDQTILLRKKEFNLLEFMMLNPDQVISRDNMLTHVWDHNSHIITNTIDSHMYHIRKKINIPTLPKLIHTVRGLGYMLGLDN